jgi:hypothetical protein
LDCSNPVTIRGESRQKYVWGGVRACGGDSERVFGPILIDRGAP